MVYLPNAGQYSTWTQDSLVDLSQGHNRASQPDSEHIITEQYLYCVNYMVTMPMFLILYQELGLY